MRVLHVIPTFYPATYWGGPLYSTLGLCDALSKNRQIKLQVLTTDSNGPTRSDRIAVESHRMNRPSGYEIYYCRRNWASAFSIEMLRRLPSMIRRADVIHLTAVYSAPTIPTLLISKLFNKPVVWSPRGALQRWERVSRPRTKRIWEIICDRLCDKNRVALHVTSAEELRQSLQIKRAFPVVIPNGVHAGPPSARSRKTKELRLLYLGRLHRIKGIENLLNAMAEVDSRVTLSICGYGANGYTGSLKTLTKNLGLDDRVRFEGHVTDGAKAAFFANSDVFVMPSFSESFGLSAAEALSYGVPVITSKGTPWHEVEKVGCGLWVENDAKSLATAITRICGMPLEEMGRKGQEWVSREFSWDAVAEKTYRLYDDLARATLS